MSQWRGEGCCVEYCEGGEAGWVWRGRGAGLEQYCTVDWRRPWRDNDGMGWVGWLALGIGCAKMGLRMHNTYSLLYSTVRLDEVAGGHWRLPLAHTHAQKRRQHLQGHFPIFVWVNFRTLSHGSVPYLILVSTQRPCLPCLRSLTKYGTFLSFYRQIRRSILNDAFALRACAEEDSPPGSAAR